MKAFIRRQNGVFLNDVMCSARNLNFFNRFAIRIIVLQYWAGFLACIARFEGVVFFLALAEKQFSKVNECHWNLHKYKIKKETQKEELQKTQFVYTVTKKYIQFSSDTTPF